MFCGRSVAFVCRCQCRNWIAYASYRSAMPRVWRSLALGIVHYRNRGIFECVFVCVCALYGRIGGARVPRKTSRNVHNSYIHAYQYVLTTLLFANIARFARVEARLCTCVPFVRCMGFGKVICFVPSVWFEGFFTVCVCVSVFVHIAKVNRGYGKFDKRLCATSASFACVSVWICVLYAIVICMLCQIICLCLCGSTIRK